MRLTHNFRMCSYNKINSAGDDGWACGNHETLAVDLKQRLNFAGWVVSDWGATHATAIGAGLDMEMPNAKFMGRALLAAVKAGNVGLPPFSSSLDWAVTRGSQGLAFPRVNDRLFINIVNVWLLPPHHPWCPHTRSLHPTSNPRSPLRRLTSAWAESLPRCMTSV